MLPYFLSKELVFPSPNLANPDGILAIGGDLSAERLLLAYQNGIFPWYSEDEPILWWSPDPRFILYPEDLKVSKSMRPYFNQNKFKITYDQAFRTIITSCSKPRPNDPFGGTWLTNEMIDAYCHLHELGFAHSVEAWQNGQIVGGLYGVGLGQVFFGESMFAKVSNASKVAFISLVRQLKELNYKLVDCQVYTKHLESLGAVEVPREDFLIELRTLLAPPHYRGNWGDLFA